MNIGLVFWIVYIIGVLVYGALNWPLNKSTGAGLIVFILIFLLGWHNFGFIIHD